MVRSYSREVVIVDDIYSLTLDKLPDFLIKHNFFEQVNQIFQEARQNVKKVSKYLSNNRRLFDEDYPNI